MNRRTRVVDGLVGAAAVIAATLPLMTLFEPTGPWLRPSLLLVLLVVLVGAGMRAVTTRRPVVVGVQALVLVLATAVVHLQGHLVAGVVPVPDTAKAFGTLLGQAYATVTQYSAPAPSTRGVILAVSLLIGVTALAGDAVAVTWRSPALAGVPLLAAYLASATNSGDGLAAWFVIPPALAWLAMVGRQGVGSLRSWGAAAPRATGPFADPASSYATVGRVAGVLALAAAVVLPSLVPHLPTTFLAEGLGRSDNGRGVGSNVRLASSVDIARDLGDRSSDPVIEYTTTATNPEPLRVGILDRYDAGRWVASSDVTFVPADGQLPGSGAGPDVPRTRQRITVTANGVGVPQVALPSTAFGSPFPDGSWTLTPTGVAVLTAPVQRYSVEYLALAPTDDQFATQLGDGGPEQADLEVDPAAQDELRTVLRGLTDPGDSGLTIARNIQAWLRGTEFTYSEELADATAQGSRSEEPLVNFLRTKRGYCVQFASAMIMLSREAGIPARMAVGFLPGTADGDSRVVRVNDAHAWPELYFPQLGWVRFEPTPGSRSGVAPGYSTPTAGTGTSTPSSSPTTSTGATPTTSARPQRDIPADTPDAGSSTSGNPLTRFVSSHRTALLVALVVLLALAVVPAGGWLARRGARRRARDDAERVEAEWASLVSRLGDLGVVAGDGSTPRQASGELSKAAYLRPEEGEALGRVVATLEQSRYARPGADLADVSGDARTVWRAALGRRRRVDRLRALLLPDEGLRHWRSLLRPPSRRRTEQTTDTD